jgi:N-acetylgalactosamine-6-sulfatase
MQRRSFLFSLAARRSRPNIVLVLADDLGSNDLSCYGSRDIRTPHIDGIAARGVRFSRFYANAPECTPTRTALLTGRYPQRVGGLECAIGTGNVGRYDEAAWLQQRGELGLPPAESVLAHALRERGYSTACMGKWHLGYAEKHWPAAHGFDESFGVLGGNADYFRHTEDAGDHVLFENRRRVKRDGYLTDLIADAAIAWIEKRKRGTPFFLYLPFTAPHAPIQDPDGGPGTPDLKGNRAIYAKMVERMDRRLGDVLAALNRTGAADNTLVIFTSDNGADANGSNAPLRGRKSSLWEGGIRAGCVMRFPGVIREGVECAQLGLTFDLTATVLAAAGARAARLDGIDLLPVATGQRPASSRTAFWRYKRAERRLKAVREGDLKLVGENGKEELYDLAADPLERSGLLASRPEDAARLRALLARWEKDVAAPRLAGFPA